LAVPLAIILNVHMSFAAFVRGVTLLTVGHVASSDAAVHQTPVTVGLKHGHGSAKLEPLLHESKLRGSPSHVLVKVASKKAANGTTDTFGKLERQLEDKDKLTRRMANQMRNLESNLAELTRTNQEVEAELEQAQAQAEKKTLADKKASEAAHAPQHAHKRSSCSCVPSSDDWVPCKRTTPKCIWIDLGAADGNSFNAFLNNYYGPVANCPSGQWEAVLVEANPRFDQALSQVATSWPGAMHMYSSTAAYMCEAQTSFYLDTVTHDNNYWGSSMSSNAADVKASGMQQVTVPTMNLIRVLYEMTIPGDWVMVKMDIEGAEWDILPCLALAPSASLVDRLFVEIHNQSMSTVGTDPVTMESAQSLLRLRGVDIPAYYSKTL
jgi:hypothetical protein